MRRREPDAGNASKLRRFFQRRFRNREDAADAAQETFLRMLSISPLTLIQNPPERGRAERPRGREAMMSAAVPNSSAAVAFGPWRTAAFLAPFAGLAMAWHFSRQFPADAWHDLFADRGGYAAGRAIRYDTALLQLAVSLLARSSLGLAWQKALSPPSRAPF
jgi:hypothetical protein